MRPIQVDTTKGYFITRSFLEYALVKMEMAPVQAFAISALENEVSAANEQLFAMDMFSTNLQAEVDNLKAIVELDRQQRDELEFSLHTAESAWKKARRWKYVATLTSIVAVVLIVQN